MHWWAIGFGLTFFVFAEGHLQNNYYALPLVFPASFFMGHGLEMLIQRRVPRVLILALCLAVVGMSARQLNFWFHMTPEQGVRIAFGKRLAEVTGSSARVVFAYPRSYPYLPAFYHHREPTGEMLLWDPIDFYHSHRKGWAVDGVQASPAFLQRLRGSGAEYFATFYPQRVFAENPALKVFCNSSATAVDANARWAIYRLP